MHTIYKLFALILLGFVAWLFFVDKFPEIKQSALEYINPVAKEERLVGELDGVLSRMKTSAESIQVKTLELANDPAKRDELVRSVKDFIDENTDFVEQSRELVEQIGEINKKKASTISSGVSKFGELVDILPFSDSNPPGKIASLSFEDKNGNFYTCSLVE